MVVLKEIEKSFLAGRVRALRGLSLEVPSGTFLTVLGPSGCGKTTLLRIVAGLESPDRGRVFIQGRDVTAVPPGRREVAMVFQNYALYPHKRVFDNIALGLRLRGLEREEIRSRIEQVARMLGIEALMERFPRQLSGGQQQRVALARALVRQPQVFLLDEPLSNLDAQVRETTRTELKRLFKALGATVIYVTHDQGEALMMSDLVAVLQDGELRQVASPMEVYHRPEHRFVAEFIGTPRINMIQGSIQDGIFSSLEGSVRFSAPVHYAGAVLLGLKIGRAHV